MLGCIIYIYKYLFAFMTGAGKYRSSSEGLTREPQRYTFRLQKDLSWSSIYQVILSVFA
uniref:Uncharacterized protein n=1 Tax=Picea glauca TaxID=3330 RepID=A0A101M3Z9_PICGL|nr:hypothetical protein ABT39_MTgene518 [Picea glauca]